MTPLPRSLYAQDAETVAKALLGAVLVFGEHRARVVETEAYVGVHDLACHAARGRTKRTEVMFGPPGYAYVYLIYGLYELLNVVTGGEGDAQAVLIRAAEPPTDMVTGTAARTDGPGKLTRALGLTRAYNRHDLLSPPLTFTAGTPPRAVVTTTRVGVDYAGSWRDAPLRFYDPDSRFVSKR